jgi:hypothetical protein
MRTRISQIAYLTAITLAMLGWTWLLAETAQRDFSATDSAPRPVDDGIPRTMPTPMAIL